MLEIGRLPAWIGVIMKILPFQKMPIKLRKVPGVLLCLLALNLGLVQNVDAQTTSSLSIIATIPVGVIPVAIAVNESTNRIYVANSADNTISVIDGATNTVVATVPVISAPSGIGVNPITNRIYVANGNGGSPLSVIDGNTNRIIASIPVDINARSVGVNPNTNQIYVPVQTGQLNGPYVDVVDGSRNEVTSTILGKSAAQNPEAIAVDPGNNRIYVTDSNALVRVIDSNTDTYISTTPYPADGGIAFNPNTNLVYVTSATLGGGVSIIDGASNTILKAVSYPFGNNDFPSGIGVNSLTNHIFVTDSQGSVAVLDGTNNTFIGNPLLIAGRPGFVAVNSATNRVYVTDSANNKVYVIIDRAPFLDLPIHYTDFSKAANGNLSSNTGRVNTWFDHTYPTYCSPPNGNGYDANHNCKGQNDNLTRFDDTYFDFKTAISEQGESWYDGHNGIDFSHDKTQDNEPVYAAANGTVINTTANPLVSNCQVGDKTCGGGYGNHVWIDHGNRYATLYGHLASVSVTAGTLITNRLSQPLGIMGSTGNSTGTHLHFGLYYDQNGDGKWKENEVVDPYGWSSTTADPWSIPSIYLWIHSLNNQSNPDTSGGTYLTPSGNGSVNIPTGALSQSITLEMWDTSPVAESSAQLRSTGNSFWMRVVEWLTGSSTSTQLVSPSSRSVSANSFDTPVTVTINFVPSSMPHIDINQLVVQQWDDVGQAWTPLATTIDTVHNQASAQTTQAGHFDLQGPLICPADALEPNDNYDGSSIVPANGSSVNNLFDIAQDEDWFQFDATAGKRYAINTTNLSAGVDTILEVYDTDGITLLASDDNSGGGKASSLTWQSPNSGVYFVRVRQGAGSAHGCASSYDFSITSLLAPVNGEVLLHRRPTFEWPDTPNAGSYQIAASKTTSFSTPLWKVTTTASRYTPAKDLPAGKVIYWRVRAQVNGVWRPWSETWSFKTGTPPSIPVLASPASKTLVRNYTPLLDWSDSIGAQHYEVQVDTDKLFTDPVLIKDDTLITSSYTTPNLLASTKYVWRVRSFNSAGEYSTWSTVWSFRTALPAPSNLIPSSGEMVSSRKPALNWDVVEGASGYAIQISNSNSFATLLFDTTTTTNSFMPTTKLPANMLIYWRVRALGTNGPSRWTTTSFHTP